MGPKSSGLIRQTRYVLSYKEEKKTNEMRDKREYLRNKQKKGLLLTISRKPKESEGNKKNFCVSLTNRGEEAVHSHQLFSLPLLYG